MPNFFEQYGFITIPAGGSLTINGTEGWKYVAILVDDASSAAAVVTSDYSGTIGGQPNGNISVAAGKALNIGTGLNAVSGVTITAPTGCTISVTCVKILDVN
jgi:hypothetical protein